MVRHTTHQEIEKAQEISYRKSIVSKLHAWIRIIFFIEAFVSGLGLFFFPFREADIVKTYIPSDRQDFCQHLTTTSGQSFTLKYDKLRDTRLAKGDTVYLEKNIFYKTEAIAIPSLHDSFFLVSKMAWMYIQAIFMVAAIASFYFSVPKDLAVKQGLSVLLEIICILYLFI